jgi:hypothetical protein
MITFEKSEKLQGEIIDICDRLDIDEEITNELCHIVKKHFRETADWARWEKQYVQENEE